MGEISGLAGLFDQYGPWTVAAVACIAIVFLWRAVMKARDTTETILQGMVKGTVELVELNTRTNSEYKAALEKVAGALQSLERRVENVEKKVG